MVLGFSKVKEESHFLMILLCGGRTDQELVLLTFSARIKKNKKKQLTQWHIRIHNTSRTNLNLQTFDICFSSKIPKPLPFVTVSKPKILTLLLQISKFKQAIAWCYESPCELAHRRLREGHQCTHTYLHLYFGSLPAMQIQTRSWSTKHGNWWGFHSALPSVTRGFHEFSGKAFIILDSSLGNNFLLICLEILLEHIDYAGMASLRHVFILKMSNWHTPEAFLYNMLIPKDKMWLT